MFFVVGYYLFLELKLGRFDLVLGLLLTLCVAVIAVLILSRSEVCEHCEGGFFIFYFSFQNV